METQLGKIESVHFGMGGYDDVQIGVWFRFSGKGWGGCFDGIGTWTHTPDEYTKWTIADQDAVFVKIVRHLMKLLQEARVNDIAKLVGKPVEVTFNGGRLESWRLLTEVL